jgi:hypothetical protein
MINRYQEYLHICAALTADTNPPAPEIRELRGLMDEWLRWAPSAPHRDQFEGWEGTFPCWEALIQTAGEVMCLDPLPVTAVPIVEACWILSDECEEMQDWAKANVQACFNGLTTLAGSSYATVRWQVYVAISVLPERGLMYLRQGLSDPDAYCRRRVAGELVRLCPSDHVELSETISDDSDDWTRRLAVELRECKPLM